MFLYCIFGIILGVWYILYSIFNRNNVSCYFKRGLIILDKEKFFKVQLMFCIFISMILLVGSILVITKILPSKEVYVFTPSFLFVIGHSIFLKIVKKKKYIDYI